MKKTKNNKTTSTARRIIQSVLVLVLLLGVAIAFYYIVKTVLPADAIERSPVIYKKDGAFFLADGEERYELRMEDESVVIFSKDRDKLIFTAQTADGTEGYDIYYYESGKKDAPKILAHGLTDNSVYATLDCCYIVFNQNNETGSAVETVLYDSEKKSSISVTTNAKEIYFPSSGEGFYITKIRSNATVLFYCPFGGALSEIDQNIDDLRFFSNEEQYNLFYHKKSENNEWSLMTAKAGTPSLVSDNAGSVFYDDYYAGENLYYLSAESEKNDWTDIIADPFKESDELMKKPDRTEYPSFFGISPLYNKALQDYQEKLIRDEIRKAVSERVEEEKIIPSTTSLYANNGEKSVLVAEKIDERKILATIKKAKIGAVVEKITLTPCEETLENLQAVAKSSSVEDAATFAINLLKNAVTSGGTELVSFENETRVSASLDADPSKTSLEFSPEGDWLYFITREEQNKKMTIHRRLITAGKLGLSEMIDGGITDFMFIKTDFWYLKPDAGKEKGDLMRCTAEKKEKILNFVHSFAENKNHDVIIFKDYASSDFPAATLHLYSNESLIKISENVSVENVVSHKGETVVYIKDFKDGKGNLCQHINGKETLLEENVSKVVAF